jgi:hypothetical protein
MMATFAADASDGGPAPRREELVERSFRELDDLVLHPESSWCDAQKGTQR